MSTVEQSNSLILWNNGLFLKGALISAGNQVGVFSPDNLLAPRFDRDDFWRWTPNSYLAISFPVAVKMESFCIDRRHTLVEGNVITIYLSNVGTDPGDVEGAPVVITVAANQVGQAIYADLDGESYLFARVEFNGTNPALTYQELGWLFMGPKYRLVSGFESKSDEPRKHVARIKKGWNNRDRIQKRTEQYFNWVGSMIKVPRPELNALWQPLNEWTANGYGFFIVADDRSEAMIAEYTRLVQWVGSTEWSIKRAITHDTDPDLDFLNLPGIQFVEMATADPSPIA